MNYIPQWLAFAGVCISSLLFSREINESAVVANSINTAAFIENKGQVIDSEQNPRRDILFSSSFNGTSIYLRNSGVSYVLIKHDNIDIEHGKDAGQIKGHRIDMEFINANSEFVVRKENQLEERKNFYLAHCPGGITNVCSYERVIYENVYNNIDFVFYGGAQTGLKYDIIVRPGGNPSDIKLKYNGADAIHIESDVTEKLIIENSINTMAEEMPRVYQSINGKTTDISAHYELTGTTVSFLFPDFRPGFDLVIDPKFWITCVGTSDVEFGHGLAIDNNGNVFHVGKTWSAAFPVSAGAFQLVNNGIYDAYFMKFNTTGALQWAVIFGGSGNDEGYAAAADGSGNAVFAGTSPSANLPITAGAYQVTPGGPYLVKVDASGALLWATWYGYGEGYGLATNRITNNIYLAGATGGGLTGTAGAHQSAFGGGTYDAYIASFNPNGTLAWATYYGGTGNDKAYDVEVDNAGNIAIGGETTGGLPLQSASQTVYGGGLYDAFAVKFNSAGVRQWATYCGGSGMDWARGVDIDNTGGVVIGGYTTSANFPVSAGAFQAVYAGGATAATQGDAFIAKYLSSGVKQWSTFLGGSASDEGFGITTDVNNDVYITGDTYSNNFPTTACASQSLFGGDEDSFVGRFDANGNRICSGYLGGGSHDEQYSGGNIEVYNSMIHISGTAVMSYATTPGAYSPYHPGGISDGFIAQLCVKTCGKKIPKANFVASQTNVCIGSSINYTDLSTSCDTIGTTWKWYFSGGTPATSTIQNPSVTYNTSGVYDVKLVLTTLCGPDSITKAAYITVNGPTVALLGVTNVSCFAGANGIVAVQAQGGTGAYTYSWNPSGGASSSASGLGPGSYTVIVSDASGCSNSVSATITQPAVLNAFVPAQTNIACNGNSTGGAMATAIGGTPGYSYSWSSVPSQNNQNSSGLAAGTYSVVVTDANGCTARAFVNLTEPPLLVANISQHMNVLCNGNSTGLISAAIAGGAGAYTYSWNTNPSQNTLTISSLSVGTYSLTVTDGNGCMVQTGATITQPTALATNTAATSAHCSFPDGSATVNVAGGAPNYIYVWSNGQTDLSATNLVAGNYSVTVTDANGCSIATSVNVPNSPGVAAQFVNTQSTSCFGTCNGSAAIAGNGGNAPYVFAWNTIPVQNNAMASGLCAGIYNVTVTDANGCTDTMNISVVQPQQMNVNVMQPATICIGQNAALSAGVQGGIPNYAFAWQPGNVNGQILNVNPAVTTIYSVLVTDANGCTATTNATVNVNPALQVAAAIPSVICVGSNVQLSASGNGGNGNYNFTWYPGGTTGSQTSVSPNTTTTYSVVLTDNCGTPADTTLVTVMVNQLPAVSFIATDSVGCTPLCLQLSNATPNTVSLTWNLGDGATSNSNNPAHCYVTPGAYSVSLTVTDGNGCSATLTKANWIIVHPKPLADFSVNPQSATILNPTVQFLDHSVFATLWSWSFGDVASSGASDQNPTFTYSDTGYFAVSLIVTNEFGCTDTAYDHVRIIEDHTFYIPNSFTPNGDGKNDQFFPQAIGVDVDEFEMWIFDRWGDQIFYTTDRNAGWDGTANGGSFPAQIDTYVWKINSKNNKGQLDRYVGHVNLLR